jgi:SAM-dependent methyltransferase
MSPSPFVVEWLRRLAAERRGGRALDVAMGSGRHSRAIADAGFRTFGVDVNFDAIRTAMRSLAAHGLRVNAWCADLVSCPLPRDAFDVIVVTRYLQRDLFAALIDALAPSGTILYETFTIAQRAHGTGPTSPDHLLEPDELRRSFAGLDILFYEERSAPDAVARLAGRRAARRS